MTEHTLSLPLVLPGDVECDRCADRLEADVRAIHGVASATVDRAAGRVVVRYDAEVIPYSRLEAEAQAIGAGIAHRIDHQTLELRDLDCPDCAASIEKAVRKIPGVIWAGANFAAAQLVAEFERGAVRIEDIQRAVESHGVRACTIGVAGEAAGPCAPPPLLWRRLWTDHRKLILTAASLMLAAAAASVHPASSVASTCLYAAAIVIGGWSTARAALMSVRSRAVDMNLLMALAILGAAAVGDWFEGATVVVLYNVGGLLQAYTFERTRRSIRSLMTLTPNVARVRHADGTESEITLERITIGEVVHVKPGERIPMDGEVIEGATSVNEAPITGEAMPAEKHLGSRVFAGTLNLTGAFDFRVSRVYRDTTLARIIHRVEEAQAQRAPAQQFIDRFARIYTPVVVLLAVLVATIPPLVAHTLHPTPYSLFPAWFLRALSLLIIACPCALVISTPVAIVTAIGSASRHGVLIKGGAYLEEMGRVRALLYDKTGTLTQGRFRVEEVVCLDGAEPAEIVRAAAAVEARSEHPLAPALADEAVRRYGSAPLRAEAFESVPGRGVRGQVAGRTYLVGNLALLREGGIDVAPVEQVLARVEAAGRSGILVAEPARPLGIVAVADTPRPEAALAVQRLRAMGVRHQAMLTGDSERVARAVAESAGLDGHRASLLPEQKMEAVREYRQHYGAVAMVGDGVNDAPALAAADVGIVMGAAGSDTAMETADVALMGDDLLRLPFLIALSRRTRAVIRQNVGFSLATKGALIVAAVTSGLPLWLAVVGDVGVSLIVTLNALRLLAPGAESGVTSGPARLSESV